ncbi:phosphoribosylglycinamide formyltransferase [Brevibacterium aurantiacum]|uniref:Phosphoribosylglycinamide formyltransferase n=1 Tax=Brevibacterium aurantiacum TaxID=273384 RepID=A0A2H1IL69_BREAU|nr:phosphoribosylglycinamide formyltransferase [Brevibacterium aurantiacum]AZL12455.1 phosphoribosylglycinamide formyltransferase [Brevibacterium aurantiacum]AZT92902.1 phosphoribosylglycinamide formyltransferase [Brevibacterium aurantiacum]PCC52276.1 phosphoribosylglycinamide formyltransferase [Brevibacterium aurantiacum]RCS86285.1 phosphoribosylglycinamide formyltransferase [Brevibacterium aurantiacum]SMX75959.1 phosphoribosylglycinamide formyltransferase-1 [Brevibacterium aurantiacum]
MRIVLLASGSGTLTQAVIDAFADAQRGVEIVGVGSDSQTAGVLDRANAHSIPTFVVRPKDCASREDWNLQLRDAVADLTPDWVISAGFMRILGPTFIAAFHNRIINTHPALLPAFPGAHGVRDALAHGVRITGGTIHLVDSGVDTGPIITQFAVPVSDVDTEDTVHERIKTQERAELVRLLTHLAHHDLSIEGRHVSGYATSASPV